MKTAKAKIYITLDGIWTKPDVTVTFGVHQVDRDHEQKRLISVFSVFMSLESLWWIIVKLT